MSEPNRAPPESPAESEEETARKEAEMLAKLHEFETQLGATKRQDPVLVAFSKTVAALESLDKGQRVRVLRAVSVLLQAGGSE